MALTRRTMIGGAGLLALGASSSVAAMEITMSELPFAATTPVSVARVGLKARDAESLAAYYRRVVGLQELSRADGAITLGAGSRPLLVLEPDASAKPDDPRSAGLFHTAFLLPSRADLGRWINHAISDKIAIEGASDHLVSEALYLTDPEGNGIEIYADRRPQDWKWNGDKIAMRSTEECEMSRSCQSATSSIAGSAMGLDFEPDAKPGFGRPDGDHFRPGIARDHRSVLMCLEQFQEKCAAVFPQELRKRRS